MNKGQLPAQREPVEDPRAPTVFSRVWYDFLLWVKERLDTILTGGFPPGVIPTSSVLFTDTDKVLGRASPGGGPGEELDFTDEAQQLADDTSFLQMRTTLGIDASTTPYTPADLADWGGVDPGEVDDALDYLASNASGFTPETIQAAETFTVPIRKQVLYAMPITVDGTLVVDGYLIEVD